MGWSDDNPNTNDQGRSALDSPSSSSCARDDTKTNPPTGSSLVIGKNLIGELRTVACPSCGHHIPLHSQEGILHDLPALPAGVKFDPTDQEILEHLEAKVQSDSRRLHPLIDEFIQTLEGENGICSTHPEKLPGVSKDGLIRHFFHRPSKAYTTGTRKRRKVHTDEEDGSGSGETRWHKTGKTRAVVANGAVKGFKKILVLYTNYGRQKKPEKTNWVMHQYHLGSDEEEKEGELVVSKVFYQTQPRQCGQQIVFREPQEQQQQLMLQQVVRCPPVVRNTAFVEYHHHPPFVSYHHHDQPQLIPNLGVQGDGSSFVSNLDGGDKQKEQFEADMRAND